MKLQAKRINNRPVFRRKRAELKIKKQMISSGKNKGRTGTRARRPTPANSIPALVRNDRCLKPYIENIRRRIAFCAETEQRLTGGKMTLADFASGHEYFGLHLKGEEWVLREWAPNASKISLIGTFSDWKERDDYSFSQVGTEGVWELRLPRSFLNHGDLYRLRLH